MAHLQQILTAAQMRDAEEKLIASGTSVNMLMERAGAGAADWVWRIAAGRSITMLCGPGNNGGDGYEIARILAQRGLAVSVVAPLPPNTDAAKQACEAWGGNPVPFAKAHVLVDCLFGTGLACPLDAKLADLLNKLAHNHEYRIAIDLPSGVNSDDGALLNEGLPHYELTVALGAWKVAHWRMPAMAQMGIRKLVPIGIGECTGAMQLAAPPKLSAPALDTHKYRRGMLAVVGGEMLGAGMLAAQAAMRGGAGYVRILAPHRTSQTPDSLVLQNGPIGSELADERMGAVLAGPGLGRGEKALAQLMDVLAADIPSVLDADALHLLRPEMLEGRSASLILTPHEGELMQLAQSFNIATSDRLEVAQALANSIHGTIIAKGPDTAIASPDAPLTLLPPAPSWLAIAGSGDVLAGLVASRLAMGEAPHTAAINATSVHGEAARLAGVALTPETLIAQVPAAIANFI